MSLPGGVKMTVSANAAQVWSYPTLHGEWIKNGRKLSGLDGVYRDRSAPRSLPGPSGRQVLGGTSALLALTAMSLEIAAWQEARAGIPGAAAGVVLEAWSDRASLAATIIDCGLGASSGLGIGQGMVSSSNCMYGLGGIALELFVPTGGGLIQGGTRAGTILLEAYAAHGRGSTVVDWAKIVSGAGCGG